MATVAPPFFFYFALCWLLRTVSSVFPEEPGPVNYIPTEGNDLLTFLLHSRPCWMRCGDTASVTWGLFCWLLRSDRFGVDCCPTRCGVSLYVRPQCTLWKIHDSRPSRGSISYTLRLPGSISPAETGAWSIAAQYYWLIVSQKSLEPPVHISGARSWGFCNKATTLVVYSRYSSEQIMHHLDRQIKKSV